MYHQLSLSEHSEIKDVLWQSEKTVYSGEFGFGVWMMGVSRVSGSLLSRDNRRQG